MKTLESKSGWQVVEEEGPDFKGKVFRNRPRSIVEMLENTVRAHPHKTGFIAGESRLTFKEFDAAVDNVAAGLARHGVRRGDRVAVLLGVQMEFPLSFFALMKIGAVIVPLNTRFKGEELAYEINDSESKALIVDQEHWPSLEPARERLDTIETIFFKGSPPPRGTIPFSSLMKMGDGEFPRAVISESDDAAIMYTSGTTGKPKGAVLHHRGFILTAMLVSDFVQFEPEDRMICCIPLFHITAISGVMLATIFSGVACVYMRQFKTKDFLEIVARERVTQYMGVVNVIWLMVNHPDFGQYDFSSFKTALLGGSLATEEMVRGISARLPHLQISVGYGLTECFAIISSTPYEDALRKIKAVGRVLPTLEAMIVDGDDRELPTGATGEIVVRGAKAFKGYWKNPAATAETLRNGWVHTGDIGKIDEEGFVYILDRKKDMINRGGEKIYSMEVENVIFDNPKIMEAAVVGVPDTVMGEAVKACLVLKPGAEVTEEEIRRFCSKRLADYKVPKFFEFLEGLPRNPAGKVSKQELRYIPGRSGHSGPFS